jgi:predicted acyltransferase
VLWLVGRLMIACFVAIYDGPDAVVSEAVCLGAPASLALAGLVAALTLLDLHRRHEAILLANLGASWQGIVALAAGPVLLLEALTCLVLV